MSAPPTEPSTSGLPSLAGRRPAVAAERLIGELVPPPRFAAVRFDTFIPDPDHPSQAAAVSRLTELAGAVESAAGSGRPPRSLRLLAGRRRRRPAAGPSGAYLDGGFGVGKTHLLASLWHAVPGPKAFGTFVEYTNLAGALGFGRTVEALTAHRLVCVDEFELDDPGDTVLMATCSDAWPPPG